MQDQTKQITAAHDTILERAIVLQVLSDDHDDGRPRSELARELGVANPAALDAALTRLRQEGVIEITDERVRASRAARYLRDREVIAV